MKRSRTEKTGALFMVSILALAGIGISYAGWTDMLHVEGTVSCGTVEFDIEEYSGTWVWKHIPTHTKEVNYGTVEEADTDNDGINDKDPNGYYTDLDYTLVSQAYCHEDDPMQQQDHVNFVFDNLYPCVDFCADFNFTIGSLPVLVTPVLDWTVEKVNGIDQAWLTQGMDDVLSDPNIPDPTVTVEILDEDGNIVYSNVYNEETSSTQTTGAGGTVIYQLHHNVVYTWRLTIHIPQHNAYQNAYAVATGYLNIIQWVDPCSPDQTDEKTVAVPDFCSMRLQNPEKNPGETDDNDPSYFDTLVWNFDPSEPPGYYKIFENEEYDGWCIDVANTIDMNTDYDNVELYSTYPGDESWLPGGITQTTWNKINYVINHKLDDTSDSYPQWKCVQWVIWYFANGGSHPDVGGGIIPGTYPGKYGTDIPDVENMISNADANGATYKPGIGEMAAVIMYKEGKQLTFIEVDP